MTKREFQAAEYAAERQPARGLVIDLRTLEQVEREHIEKVLATVMGNRTHAARALGISVRSLQRKLKAWGIQDRLPLGVK